MKTPHLLHHFTVAAILFAAVQVQAYFDPRVGRWASRDPITEKGGRNLYVSVGNNPITRFDVLGLVGMGELRLRECGRCGPDVTASITSEFGKLKSLIDGLPYPEATEGNSAPNNAMLLTWFARVAPMLNYAEMIQQRELNSLTGGSPGIGCNDTITLCGKCVFSDIPGNLMFGYMADRLGILNGIRNTAAWLVELDPIEWLTHGKPDGEWFDEDQDIYNIAQRMAKGGSTDICSIINSIPARKLSTCKPSPVTYNFTTDPQRSPFARDNFPGYPNFVPATPFVGP